MLACDSIHTVALSGPAAAARQAADSGWAFDLVSFALGLLTALLLVVLVYRSRALIARQRDRVKDAARRQRQRLTATMASRYCTAVIERAQTMHLLAGLASLESIFVHTQFLAPLARTDDADAPVSLSPPQAIQASDRLCILGRPGSGRTTLLGHLLLLHATQVRKKGDSERVPIYVYLPGLALELTHHALSEVSSEKDSAPGQQLVHGALSALSATLPPGVARWLRRQVEDGNTLVLLDGWDEVPSGDRPAVTGWLRQLYAAYPGQRLVVAAGESGYAPLVEAGFYPLQPAPWTHSQLTQLSQHWRSAWPFKDDSPPDEAPVVSYTLTVPTPLEATIDLAIHMRNQRPASTPTGKMTQILTLLLPEPEVDKRGQAAWPFETAHRALGQLALAAQERGQPILRREEIQAAVAAAMPPLLPEVDESETADKSAPTREEQERRTLQIADCCRALTRTGAPIQSWNGQRYYFSHPLVAAYLTARHLAIEGADIVAHADDPAWSDVLRYYAGLASAEPLLDRLLSLPDDILLSRFWAAASLLATAPKESAPWRVKLMKRLGQLFMNPRLPELLRDRAMRALLESGEAGVAPLFKQMASSPEPTVRAKAILGLGGLAREQDLDVLEAALDDADADVRLAAIRALGVFARLGIEQAADLIIAGLIETEGNVQRVAAETLAELGPTGEAVLREGAQDQDLVVRRAAVYGLAALDQPWSREMLAKMEREDDEWFVRNAALEALAHLETGSHTDTTIELSLPRAEAEPWLVAWAAERGVGTGVGEAALATLTRALAEDDLPIRQAAVDSLRRLADPRTIDLLRQTLRDPEPTVRDTALLALNEISRRYALPITLN